MRQLASARNYIKEVSSMEFECGKITCEECMPDSPHDWCCKRECGEHEFCRGCEYWNKRISSTKRC